jgi:dolichol-phosphate mannosyltransferase
MSKGTVLIPTLNEEEVIGKTVDKLSSFDVEIIVIDADSQDLTREKAREKGAKVVNKKTNNDLANSVMTGIEHASNEKIVVMDGDGQHPVKPVKQFLTLLEENSLVVGYRERAVDKWPIHRKALSKGAELMARTAFRECRNVKDPLSGFFGFRKNDFDFETFNPRGYKLVIEFLVKNRGSFGEVGYVFYDRQGGNSSIGLREIIDYSVHLADLKYRQSRINTFQLFKLLRNSLNSL